MAIGNTVIDPKTGAASVQSAPVQGPVLPASGNTSTSGASNLSALNPDISGLNFNNKLPSGATGAPSGLVIPGDMPNGPIPGQTPMPPLPKAPPPPPPFKPEVPTTIDSHNLSDAYANPVTVSPALKQLMDENDRLAQTGSALPPQYDTSHNPGGSQGGTSANGVTGTSGSPPPGGTPSPAMSAADIAKLFPENPSTATAFDQARTDLGIPDFETQYFAAQQDYANLQAAYKNIPTDLANEVGGAETSSTEAAAIADRQRRIQPMLDQKAIEMDTLQNHLTYLNDLAVQKTGYTQADIENARTAQENARTNVTSLLTQFGADAFANVDPAAVAAIEQKAGLPPGTLTKGTKTIDEQVQLGYGRWNPQVVNGRLMNFDKSTGQWEDTGITAPPGQDQMLTAAVSMAGNLTNPQDAFAFINQFMSGSLTGGAGQPLSPYGKIVSPPSPAIANQTVSSLSEQDRGNLLVAMIKREGFGADPNNIPTRLNNPADIELGASTQHWVDSGQATVETEADGRKFLKFNDAATGLQAADELLSSPLYSNLTVDAALRQWSGGGYGAEIMSGSQQPAATQPTITFGASLDPSAPADLQKQMRQVNAGASQDQQLANDRQFNLLVRSGNLQDAQDYVNTLAVKSLPADQQSNFTNFNSANKQAAAILQDLNKGGGISVGPYADLYNKNVTWAAGQKDPKYVDLFSKISSMKESIISAYSAMRLTTNQQNLFDQNLPDENDDMQTIVTKLARLQSFTKGQMGLLVNQAKGNY